MHEYWIPPDDDRQQLQEAFDVLDPQNKSRLTVDEFAYLLKNCDWPDEEIQLILSQVSCADGYFLPDGNTYSNDCWPCSSLTCTDCFSIGFLELRTILLTPVESPKKKAGKSTGKKKTKWASGAHFIRTFLWHSCFFHPISRWRLIGLYTAIYTHTHIDWWINTDKALVHDCWWRCFSLLATNRATREFFIDLHQLQSQIFCHIFLLIHLFSGRRVDSFTIRFSPSRLSPLPLLQTSRQAKKSILIENIWRSLSNCSTRDS